MLCHRKYAGLPQWIRKIVDLYEESSHGTEGMLYVTMRQLEGRGGSNGGCALGLLRQNGPVVGLFEEKEAQNPLWLTSNCGGSAYFQEGSTI